MCDIKVDAQKLLTPQSTYFEATWSGKPTPQPAREGLVNWLLHHRFVLHHWQWTVGQDHDVKLTRTSLAWAGLAGKTILGSQVSTSAIESSQD